jgi:hypothetical protein
VKQIGSRVTIEHSIGGPAVRIRAPRNWGALIFLPIWLAGWTFGGVLAIGAFFREPQLFLGVWLIGWLSLRHPGVVMGSVRRRSPDAR